MKRIKTFYALINKRIPVISRLGIVKNGIGMAEGLPVHYYARLLEIILQRKDVKIEFLIKRLKEKNSPSK